MHRLLSSLVILAALYVTAGCTATYPPVQPAQPPGPAVPGVAVPQPASAPAVTAPAPVPQPPVTVLPGAQPHIALLLPLNDPRGLGQAAKAVQQGFIAAAGVHPGALPVRVYACADESKEIAALYKQALANGARAVVGPLTPAGVAALASQPITVPTLVLNRVETKAPDQLYSFGIMLENEARQAARVASLADLHTAIIVSSNNALSRRVADAFQAEWKRVGGAVAANIVFKGDTGVFADLPIEPGNMVFIAANADTARKFRPFLNAMLPVYSTSQIFKGNTHTLINYDLRDVVFFDMPWLLQQDHALVMRYPHLNPPGDVDMERLYALGIDSYRLIRILLDNNRSALPLEGVTGTVSLGANHVFEREALQAEFVNGLGMTPEAYKALKKATRSGTNPNGPVDPAESE